MLIPKTTLCAWASREPAFPRPPWLCLLHYLPLVPYVDIYFIIITIIIIIIIIIMVLIHIKRRVFCSFKTRVAEGARWVIESSGRRSVSVSHRAGDSLQGNKTITPFRCLATAAAAAAPLFLTLYGTSPGANV